MPSGQQEGVPEGDDFDQIGDIDDFPIPSQPLPLLKTPTVGKKDTLPAQSEEVRPSSPPDEEMSDFSEYESEAKGLDQAENQLWLQKVGKFDLERYE